MSKFRDFLLWHGKKGIFLRRLMNPFGITTWGVAYLISRSIFDFKKVIRAKTLGNKWKCEILLCFWFFLQFKKIMIEIKYIRGKLHLKLRFPTLDEVNPRQDENLKNSGEKSISWTLCSLFRTWMLLLALLCGIELCTSLLQQQQINYASGFYIFRFLTMQFTALHFHVSEDSRRKSKINISQSRLLVSFVKYATNINLISTLISISTMALSGVTTRAFYSFSLCFLRKPSLLS